MDSDDLQRAIESLNNNDPELTSLDLFSLDIGDEGTRQIAFAIANNTQCNYLSLWYVLLLAVFAALRHIIDLRA